MNWDDLKVFIQVAKSERLSEAAKYLNIDASTASRRLHKLEKDLQVRLFERSTEGHVLTKDGKLLLQSACLMEENAQSAMALLQGKDLQDSGTVRVGITEGFGNYFVTPRMMDFCRKYPKITIDLLPLPRFVKLTLHEADMAVTIERPTNPAMIGTKLCDYRLKLYASHRYLQEKGPIKKMSDLTEHDWVGYVEAFAFSEQMSYLSEIAPLVTPRFRSSSVINHYAAAKAGLGLAILPCFMADRDPDLTQLLENKVNIVRSFWLEVHPDLKRLIRVNLVWNYLKTITRDNKYLLMGG